jgi:plastocyanin
MHRRRLLQSLAVGLTTAFAGCGESADATPAETTPGPDTPAESSTPASTATPTETPTATPEPTPEPTPTPTPAAQTVEVGADGRLSFAPDSFTISAGDTVEWVWDSSNHNVTPESMPSDADWTGSPGSPDRLFDEGYTYRYTFEVAGEYTYYCNPHRGAGMTGSFTVTE